MWQCDGAAWRYHEHLGYDTIAERLNADLTSYPPPEPPGGRRARGAWGKTSVYDILNAGPRHRLTVEGLLVHNCVIHAAPTKSSLLSKFQSQTPTEPAAVARA